MVETDRFQKFRVAEAYSDPCQTSKVLRKQITVISLWLFSQNTLSYMLNSVLNMSLGNATHSSLRLVWFYSAKFTDQKTLKHLLLFYWALLWNCVGLKVDKEKTFFNNIIKWFFGQYWKTDSQSQHSTFSTTRTVSKNLKFWIVFLCVHDSSKTDLFLWEIS